jgi:hypothetical protein
MLLVTLYCLLGDPSSRDLDLFLHYFTLNGYSRLHAEFVLTACPGIAVPVLNNLSLGLLTKTMGVSAYLF